MTSSNPQSVQEHRAYYFRHERANQITHGLGLLASLVGFVLLFLKSLELGDPVHTVCYLVYGFTLIILYGSSTLYHSVHTPRLKHRYRILDHVAIYFLIAGTYTPFTLLVLPAHWGIPILAINWVLAFAGTFYKVFLFGKYPRFSTLVYLLMGWLIMVAAAPLFNSLSPVGFNWVVAGGISYTLGVLFFMWDSLPYNHAIWHLFVLGGSACHFVCVLYYI